MEVATSLVSNPEKSGIYHFAGSPEVTWAGFAREIFWQAGKSVEVKGILSAQYETKAKRPHNSRLDCLSFEAAFGLHSPDWKSGLNNVLRELGAIL
jgi:dTDP-4-dehydrorhamnose reductase